MSEVIQLQSLRQLRDPVMVVAFAVRRRAGRLASTTLSYLIGEWKAEKVARIDPEDLIDFTVRRPDVRYVGDDRTLDWPETAIHLATPPGANRDFLLTVGFEPNFRWRGFVESLADYADAAGIKTLVTLRALPGSVPHTRPAPVLVNSSDVELELQFGVQSRGYKYEGPIDVAGVLAAQVQTKRWQTVDLSVLQPYYFPRMPNAQATMALIKALDNAFGTDTAVDSLLKAAEEQARLIEENFSDANEARTMIEELETRYDESLDRLEFLSPAADQTSNLPTGEELINEIERLFRQGGTKPEQD